MIKKIFSVQICSFALFFAPLIVHASLIINGDFESGNEGFITDYSLDILAGDQRYDITADPSLNHSGADSYGDHTSGSGLMMAVNGAGTGDQLVWGQDVTLEANVDYEFSLWVSSWISTSPASLQFDLGGLSLGLYNAPTTTGQWEQYSYTFNSGALSGSQFLSIIDTELALVGNDFAIDDISLTAISPHPVPLPPSLLLLGTGLVGLLISRRKAIS